MRTRENGVRTAKGEERFKKDKVVRTSLVVQWLRIHLPMQGIRSLVRELRSHVPRGN